MSDPTRPAPTTADPAPPASPTTPPATDATADATTDSDDESALDGTRPRDTTKGTINNVR